MSNIIPFDSTGSGEANLPAHLANVFGDDVNITPRVTINHLSYRGKVWRRIVEGEEVPLTRINKETNEQEPVTVVNIIILDHNKQRSRSFFEDNYEDGKNQAPRCYSGDGVKPDASVKEPIALTCATCPNSVKGSKITENGKQTTLCSPFKRVAVVPSAQIGEHPAMLLKLAQTSIWDKENPEEAKGWYAWDNYLDMLRARGAKHTAMVETRVKFDLRVAYPKLLFSASRWLSPEEAMAAKQLMVDQADDIATVIEGAGNRDGVMGKPAATNGAAGAAQTAAPTQTAAPQSTQAPKKPTPPPKPTPAPTPAPKPKKIVKKLTDKAEGFTLEQWIAEGWTEDQLIAEGMLVVTEELDTPASPPKPRGPKKPPAAASQQTTIDMGGAAEPPAQAPAPSPAAGVVTDTPAGLADLLNGWDDQ